MEEGHRPPETNITPGFYPSTSSCASGPVTVLQSDADPSGCSCTNDATPKPLTAGGACANYHPGHYLRIPDGAIQGEDGVANIRRNLARDLTNVTGFNFDSSWPEVEKSQGVYDFSHIDAAVALARSRGKYMTIILKERTFHRGCNSKFIPDYVQRHGDPSKPPFCIARIWEKETMDHYIAVMKAIATHYKDDPTVLGFDFGETAIAGLGASEYLALYEQLKRLHREVHAVAPNKLLIQMFNWPLNGDLGHFRAIADNFIANGIPGGIAWPDTPIPPSSRFTWHQFGKDYSNRLLLMPHQEGYTTGSVADSEAFYRYTTQTLGAHVLVWNNWYKGYPNYQATVVIPTINKYATVTTKGCPWSGSAAGSSTPSGPTKTCTASPTQTGGGTGGSATPAAGSCSRFQPGHYIRVADSKPRNVDGLAVLRNVLSNDVRNFKGIAYQFDWGMIEKSPGVYDFSRLDAALSAVKAKGKYLILKIQDRTYWTGCNSGFVPSYVAQAAGTGGQGQPTYCIAKIWQQETMDQFIRVLQQLAMRYKDDRSVIGISLEETSIPASAINSNWSVFPEYYRQLKRAHVAVHSVAPDLIINQYVNWPVNYDNTHFYQIADNFTANGIPGGIGWPDSLPWWLNDFKQGGLWYKVARDRNTKVLVIPGAETTFLDGSQAQTEQVYNMLVNDIGAHMIIWDTWAQNGGGAYLTNALIPTINKYNGAIKNMTCPFSGN